MARADFPPCRRVLLACVLALSATACRDEVRHPKVPGESDRKVRKVSIVSDTGRRPALDPAPLYVRLGLRAKQSVYTDRYYNRFRLNEDRRRVLSYFHNHGYFDAEVLDPVVVLDDIKNEAEVTWKVREGQRYALAPTVFHGEVAGSEVALQGLFPKHLGLDIESFRKARYAMSEHLQRLGFGHARVYSRTYVDRKARTVAPHYFVELGPKTRVKSIHVVGNAKVDRTAVLARVPLREGAPYDLKQKEEAERLLLDTGAFSSVNVSSSADTEMFIGNIPDTGGVITEDRITESGDFVPRKLDPDLDVTISVVEAPKVRVRLRGSVEVDPKRLDTTVGAEVPITHAFGTMHHLMVEGYGGYGVAFRDREDFSGPFGGGLVRWVHPGLASGTVSLRMTAAARNTLYPGFHNTDFEAGPGLRYSPRAGLFFDLDGLARMGLEEGFGPFDAATRDRASLANSPRSSGFLAKGSLVYDRRNDPLETLSGHLEALRVEYSPGGPLGTHRWLSLSPEVRLFVPLVKERWTLASRAYARWTLLGDGDGLPLAARSFGGGAYGFRGLTRNWLSPSGASCIGGDCIDVPLGAQSLFEASIEARYLPPQEALGFAFFHDFGAASLGANPFEDGLSLALGGGVRIRTWYVTVAIDLSYRYLYRGQVDAPNKLDPFHGFVRIGEAF